MLFNNQTVKLVEIQTVKNKRTLPINDEYQGFIIVFSYSFDFTPLNKLATEHWIKLKTFASDTKIPKQINYLSFAQTNGDMLLGE